MPVRFCLTGSSSFSWTAAFAACASAALGAVARAAAVVRRKLLYAPGIGWGTDLDLLCRSRLGFASAPIRRYSRPGPGTEEDPSRASATILTLFACCPAIAAVACRAVRAQPRTARSAHAGQGLVLPECRRCPGCRARHDVPLRYRSLYGRYPGGSTSTRTEAAKLTVTSPVIALAGSS